MILNIGRAAARPYIRMGRIYLHMQLTTGTALLNVRVISKAKIGFSPAKRALRPGVIFASIATWDVLPSLASADAFRRLASYSALSYQQSATTNHGLSQISSKKSVRFLDKYRPRDYNTN